MRAIMVSTVPQLLDGGGGGRGAGLFITRSYAPPRPCFLATTPCTTFLNKQLANSPSILRFGAKIESLVAAGGSQNLSIRATTQVNYSGYIDSSMMHSMEMKIKEALNAESVVVKDAYGDGRHVSIDVVSSAFEDQSEVNRQRMVYKAIREELESIVHAVDEMTTRTPTEAGTKN